MRLLAPKPHDGASSFGLLALRATVGMALCFHGWSKIEHITDWMEVFKIPDPAPGYLQALAVISEFAGGIALTAGLLTPLAALGILCTMGYAVNFHLNMGHSLVPKESGQGSYELALTYAMTALLMLLAGPGRLSLDQVMFAGKKK